MSECPLDLSFQKVVLDLSCPASNARRQYQPSHLAPDTLVEMNKRLLSEILHLIFAMLPFEDLNQVLLVKNFGENLVCRRWREVGETPVLWAGFELKLSRKNKYLIRELVDCGRLALVRKMAVHAFITKASAGPGWTQGVEGAYCGNNNHCSSAIPVGV